MVLRGTRRRLAGLVLCLLTGAVVVTSSSPAAAQKARKKPPAAAPKDAPAAKTTPEKTRAAELFKKSADAYLHGDFATAISLLDEAYALDPQPVLVYNMARAHEGLGHLDEAINYYERYLNEDPSSPDRGAIEQRLSTLQKQREEKARLDKERAEVEERRVLQEEQNKKLEQREREASAGHAEAPRRRSPLPYVVAGVGAAGLAAGGVFGILALDKQSAGRKAVSLKDATEARDTGETFATISNVAFVAGGALVTAGVVWWVLDRSATKGQQGTAKTLTVGFGPGSASLSGEF
jgi:tetratricopeptide (TPR) repeat protein